MADDLGDEWWLNDDENDVLNAQSETRTNKSKSSFAFSLFHLSKRYSNATCYFYYII